MKSIRIGGVPEHFNLPWHLCIEENEFNKEEINVIWKDFPGGTGAMNNALRSGEIDAAVILTEGITRDIINGNEAKIVQTYIGSPLIWGIHVAADSRYRNLKDLEHTKAAISREGSGSHLMAYVNAQNNGWNFNNLDFEIVKDLDGAVEALKEDKAQYFMWEHFTTKPLVDNHTFRLISDCPTPWPCFVIAVRDEVLKYDSQRIHTMLKVLNRKTSGFKDIPGIDEILAQRYDQKLEDIRKWLKVTTWSNSQLSEKELNEVQSKLLQLKLIPKQVESSEILYSLQPF
ncbi:substrate-binding domain-containing protein [Salegentibacter sp. F188]|uniref:Substrate-binding domain-containing protein n=1 Tax=Autumnicola patrickiae TaxID=3075591 RepID=A0ABU3E2Q0_9FLAO|nr:substrate-binding domain-containing protein [Salegentibacter sp. F188]MDT0690178.1 substrate-binding domain-containing protein [Salegentibacter sp. F188]